MKDQTAFTSLGGVQSLMVASLVGSILMAPGEMRRPKYLTSVESNAHFDNFRASCCSRRRSNTHLVRSWWSARSSEEWMSMSSI